MRGWIPATLSRKQGIRSAMMSGVGSRLGLMAAGFALVATSAFLAACGNKSPNAAPEISSTTSTTTTITTTTTTPPTTAVDQGVAVPNVLGMKIPLARFYLRTAKFALVPFNAACNKGNTASQSVVVSLSIPGKPPTVTVGAQPLIPGTTRPKGSAVGVTWSGCYPGGTQVPTVVGHTFSVAVHLLHLGGLNWSCYSVGSAHPPATTTTHVPRTTTTTTTTTANTTSSTDTTTTTAPPTTTTTTAPRQPQTVLSQGTPPGNVVQAGSVVELAMHHCPQ